MNNQILRRIVTSARKFYKVLMRNGFESKEEVYQIFAAMSVIIGAVYYAFTLGHLFFPLLIIIFAIIWLTFALNNLFYRM